MIWTEETIRDEIRKLDETTGLEGAKLPIVFGRAKTRLGAFYMNQKEMKPVKFYFSRYYFGNPGWPMSDALDVIRHEYAHYMSFELYGHSGHGGDWKRCCVRIGARPERLYKGRCEDVYQESKTNPNIYEPGMNIVHPVFGKGTIQNITNDAAKKSAVVKFSKVGLKKLGIHWMMENCRLI